MFNKNPILNTWVPLFHPNFPIVLFWSQKSGCTSLFNWFFFQLGLLKEAERSGGVHWYRYNYVNENNYKKRLMNQIKIKDCYKLVRNPYKRSVSAFIQVLSTQTDEYRKINKSLYNDENSNKGISFKQFIHYIKINLPGGSIDSHCFPQYFDNEEKYVKNNYIYLEDFDHHLSKIEQKYKLKKSHSSLFKSPHHNSHRMIEKGYFSEFKFTRETIQSGKLPTYESFYDEELKNLVRSIYNKDFEIYGYDQDL
ncbi:sulfotransferase family 2 domain-containing protein [Thermoactinomyces sp. CICC 10523]|uniref:sulfotransferase family 2 domain-containing protein n=1 Tax=Thermoactinomyces sp. CICC 10523 TaxID=2767428 RepID=UPI0018DC2194|nr:sulfotransferase family 2 domain-containing protein [Thermoactinomyces sp. CICC 10523]MBH8597297.1 sulfotransferase family 2 domain-containing protein [Thermoactinomyces sp. CICC 10523]